MLKFLAKIFMPSPKTLAKTAAQTLQKLVNESGRQEQIAKYGALADKATEIQTFLTGILKDGQIDAGEADEIAKKLEPLFQKLEELI